jgi:hypothetical protein
MNALHPKNILDEVHNSLHNNIIFFLRIFQQSYRYMAGLAFSLFHNSLN